ncbi:hypothetical protein [Demequina iriomotensis]|uniref:hypothetical protein n=1 Tax=Demequina iriomotensis TaxID=1536641 RepID=UPI000784025C|nr:hypothetical protein [Demequina iriomotensis]
MRLSDALRSAADRAPLDGIEVDTSRARRRAATQRGLRMGANGTLAGGMVVVLGFGISGAVGAASSMSSADDAAREEAAVAQDDAAGGSADMGGMAPEAAGGGAASSALAWGVCGEALPDVGGDGADPVARIDANVTSPEVSDGVIGFEAGLASGLDATYETFGISGVVLWDGIVVATVPDAADVPAEAYAGQLMSDAIGMEMREAALQNCWDGAALPAGDYTLVLTQELWNVSTEAFEDVPEPAPSDGAGTDDAATDGDVTDGDAATSGIAADASFRLVSEPLAFSVAGDAVEDPFGAYLGTVDEPKPDPRPAEPSTTVPDGALDPATARDLYAAGLVGAWDMAPGTQRWTVTGDSTGRLAATWYGCGSDEGVFPARSAQMDLLRVDVDAPASIDVSYGWVVENNPELHASLANVSEWDLAQFWGMSELRLVLVRDGRVVAETYAVNPERDAYAIDVATAAREGAASSEALGLDGMLPSGGSAAGTFLWRDVNGCWTDTGSADVAPGTYTLLASHYLTVGGGTVTMVEDWTEGGVVDESWSTDGGGDVDLGGATSGVAGSTAGADAAMPVAPDAYDTYDAVDFEVWTSLGTVTVR